jgi:heat-inducible transcriptional repressor
VFLALLSLYDRTARPVGSETLASEAGIPLSPASIRSALEELESLGLIERTHSSSGRVPSGRGYDYYVRALATPARLPDETLAEIRATLQRSSDDVQELLLEASRVLSSLTHQLGLAVASVLDDDRLARLDLVSLAERRAMMVLDLEGGSAQTLVLELESALSPAELEEVGPVLRERLLGRTLAEVRDRLVSDPELVRRSAVRLVVHAAADSWARAVTTPLFSAGAGHIAEQPEFAMGSRLGPVLRAVERGTPLDRWMVSGIEGHAGVRIGLDPSLGLSGLSLVSYSLPGTLRAAVGVLGPMRMNYPFALAVVDTVGAKVADLLQSSPEA